MTDVVVVGAGPAGATLAGLLAHRGIKVTLLERRQDFAREFRGEILMPSGMAALQDMGIAHLIDKIPHHTQTGIAVFMNGRQLFHQAFDPEDLRGLPPVAISQPAFLQAVIDWASESEHFEFISGVSIRDLLTKDGQIAGVTIRDGNQTREIAARLTVGADGRNSFVRRSGDFNAQEKSPPMDIVWCKIPCPEEWPYVHAYAGKGNLLFCYKTWDGNLQLGWVILKGTFGDLRARGIEEWVDVMANHVDAELGEYLRTQASAIQRPFLLDAEADCVDHWGIHGALLIGDAAHTMSPVGGQGVNVALRDAIVAANHLVPALQEDQLSTATLAAIQAERMPEIAPIQNIQAQPPKLMLSRKWWGEPLRKFLAWLIRKPQIRARAGSRVMPFLFGVTEVKLKV